MKVLVACASRPLSAALLPVLCDSAAIEAVTTTDPHRARFEHPKLKTVPVELHDANASGLLAGHDALVHHGPNVAGGRGAAHQPELTVRPAHKLFQAAHAAGVQRLVHISTAAVYGPVVHASEQNPLRPLAGFDYAQQQAHLEKLLAIDFPHCVRLRPHVVVGPHAHGAIRRVLRQPFYPRRADPQPLFQCVHEEDLANAVLLSLCGPARGAYNIATEDSFTLQDAIRARRGFSLGVPATTARSLMRLAGRYLRFELDPVWIERTAHTVLVNCRRAISELGWSARYTARQALAET